MTFDQAVARLIDHTILKPEATRAEVLQTCAEARRFGFATVCVNPFWVSLVASELVTSQLRGANVKVCSVVGFPLGANTTAGKVQETRGAIADGAAEIDMVINIGALRGGEEDVVRNDIQTVANECHKSAHILKAIIETALLNDDEKRRACRLAVEAGADFVKTSTGFSKSGATAADIALMRAAVGPNVGVKASGGIRTLRDLRAMVAAGATRIGASASVAILMETAQVAADSAVN